MTDDLKRFLDTPENAKESELFEEIKSKIELAETVQKFYGGLSKFQHKMIDDFLPVELKALLDKGK